ncbi:hypothetical protein HDU93_003132, partial [Gonapodya sp. JEL0774]
MLDVTEVGLARGDTTLQGVRDLDPNDGSSIIQNINPFFLSLGGSPFSGDPIPLKVVLVASMSFVPTLTDELELVEGTAYYIDLLWGDGWCYGRNLSTGAAGYAPIVALQAATASFDRGLGDIPQFSQPIPELAEDAVAKEHEGTNISKDPSVLGESTPVRPALPR